MKASAMAASQPLAEADVARSQREKPEAQQNEDHIQHQMPPNPIDAVRMAINA
jgi:hypothetical protein